MLVGLVVVLLLGSRGGVHAFSLTTTTTTTTPLLESSVHSIVNHPRRIQTHKQRQLTTKRNGLHHFLQMVPDPETASSTITNSLLGIGETLAVGNIVTATLLFGAGVVATLKRGEESSGEDKALKEKVLQAPQIGVSYQTDDDSTVEVVEIKEEEETPVVEPVRVKNQQTETPLEKEVVKDLMVEVKETTTTDVKAPTETFKKDIKQLKKDVSKTVESVQQTLESPVMEPIDVTEKDITRLKTEIGNTLAKEGTAGIKRGTGGSVSKEDLKDIKDQVQESLNVASGGTTKKPSKRRFVVKLVKKIVMPWKAWKNL